MAAADKVTALASAVGRRVEDGIVVGPEGFGRLILLAAAHEPIDQRHRNLTLCWMTPDLLANRLIGAGRVRRLVASFFASRSTGSLHAIRRRFERPDPAALEVGEYSHYGMVCRDQAGTAPRCSSRRAPTPVATCPGSTRRSRSSAIPPAARTSSWCRPLGRNLSTLHAQHQTPRQGADAGHRGRPAGSRLRRAHGHRRRGTARRIRGGPIRPDPHRHPQPRRHCRRPGGRPSVLHPSATMTATTPSMASGHPIGRDCQAAGAPLDQRALRRFRPGGLPGARHTALDQTATCRTPRAAGGLGAPGRHHRGAIVTTPRLLAVPPLSTGEVHIR